MSLIGWLTVLVSDKHRGIRVRLRWDSGRASIEDRACGIPQEFWVLREETEGKTAQFHEGMKLAALVLAREGRQVRLEAVGYTVRPSLDPVEASRPA